MGYGIPSFNQISDALTRRAFQYLDIRLGEQLPSSLLSVAGAVLTAVGDGTSKWQSPETGAFQCDITNQPTITFGTHTAIGGSASSPSVTWTKDIDISTWFDTTTGRYTPQVKGLYEFSGVIYWAGFNVDQTQTITDIFKNGTLQRRGQIARSSGGAGIDAAPSVLPPVLVKANGTTDYFQLGYFITGAGSLFNGNGAVYFSGKLISQEP